MGSEAHKLSRSPVWLLLLAFSATAAAATNTAATRKAADDEEAPTRGWHVLPSLELAEIYSDNINLASSGREDWDFVTEIAPALSLTGESARLKADAHYRLQNLVYLHEPSRSAVNQQFVGRGTAEAVEDHLFVDADGTYTQVLIDPSSGAATDNINTPARQNVYTMRLSPYYLEDLGGYATANARYSYGIARYETNVSDTDVERADLGLTSGRQFTRLGWSLNYYDEKIKRPEGASFGDAEHRVAVADVSYAVTRHFSVIGRAGDEQHDYEVANVPFENGTYTAAGLEWRPNRHTKIRGLYGSRYQSASIDWNPTSRTSMHVGWRDTQVGVNPGQIWDANVSLHTRRTLWSVRYNEEPSSVQQLALQGTVPLFVDPTTLLDPRPAISLVPLPGYIFLDSFDFFAPVNQEFIRKRGTLLFGFHSGRTSVTTQVYDERREYLQSGQTEQIRGVIASGSWRFLSRTSYLLSGSFARSDLLTGSEFDLWRVETGLSEQISSKATGSLLFTHTDRGSSGPGNGYTENRVTLRLLMQF